MKSHDAIAAFAREALGLRKDEKAELFSFEGRGSDRSYHRFCWSGGNSAIVVSYEPRRVENTYYPGIAVALRRSGIPVPEIICHDSAGCLILMQDLGDLDLWSLRNESWERRREFYRRTLEIVHRLHACSGEEFLSGRVALMEPFGSSLYRWERDYFRDNFVKAFCGIELNAGFAELLEHELAEMASRLVSHERTLVHRDLQSQNVMICRDEPFLIDFQGMRFGTRFYDLGSLLCDPYVHFSPDERTDLLAFYYRLSVEELDWSEFQKRFWEASAQRLMQALGAYGFLGLTKGLRSYLVHVPTAVRNLHTAAEKAGSLPALLEICNKCESRRDLSESRP